MMHDEYEKHEELEPSFIYVNFMMANNILAFLVEFLPPKMLWCRQLLLLDSCLARQMHLLSCVYQEFDCHVNSELCLLI